MNIDSLRAQCGGPRDGALLRLTLGNALLAAGDANGAVAEMRQALADGDLIQLSRLAHTIKGSLGSLQAPAARAEAQLLELAALRNDREACGRLLPSFESKLNELEAALQTLTRTLVENQ